MTMYDYARNKIAMVKIVACEVKA